LVGKAEGKRPLGRPRPRWGIILRWILEKIGWGGLNWTDLAQERGPVEGSCEHGNEPSGYIKRWKFLSSCTTGGFSRRAHLHEIS
jgi:hypothetical protein